MSMHFRLGGIHAEKDINLVIIKCNSTFAHYTGFKSKEDLLGKTDFDLSSAEYASEYKKHEMDALSGNHYSTIIPVKDYKGDLRLFTHTKIRKTDEKGNVNGVICHAIEIFNPNIYKLIQILAKINNEKKPVYTIGKKNSSPISLSQREEQCLFYLVHGKTAKVIGKILGLSYRTIEYYIANIKLKLGCSTKMELIDKAINEGYMKDIPGFLMPSAFSERLKT